MGVDIADALPEEPVQFNEAKYFFIVSDARPGQASQIAQDHFTRSQVAERQLANNERVGERVTIFEEANESGIVLSYVIDPDRSIDENHLEAGRRRGTDFMCG